MSKLPKQKTCKICKDKFIPIRELQPTCTRMDCMIDYANNTLRKSALKQQKARNKAIKEFKSTDRTELQKKAIKAFNEFIRLRDYHLACISCGTPKDIQYHSGH
ncbi:MAG: hypothetical protein COB42_08205 [Sulfurimonas sp.]|nr:MAG: hypothetical protein COB42_08205 [Sulfurimonas sp.]